MKIALLTGGGDCPGMNAFIRSVTRSHLNLGGEKAEVRGVLDGWAGMISGSYRQLSILDTAGIGRVGGTILGTLRAPELKRDEALQKKVADDFLAEGFDALVACGGNGSLKAALNLDQRLTEMGETRPILFTGASIDNDVANLHGTSIGFYSAIERSVEMMEWIRDTASAHRRVYIVGSMGRRSANLPFVAGLASGAEFVIRPDEQVDYGALADMIDGRDRDTRIIVSEAYPRTVEEIAAILAALLEQRSSAHEIRTVDMGYFQRGGMASVTDVLRANRVGHAMILSLLRGEGSAYFGAFHAAADPNRIPLEEAASPEATYDDIPPDVIEMAIALR